MSSITSLANPSLFATAPALPEGFYYQLNNTGQNYIFGQKNPLYFIQIIRSSDNATIQGNDFFPSDAYPDVPTMIEMECTNVFVVWQSYDAADTLETAAKTLIGF
jgi:hypothetical protein